MRERERECEYIEFLCFCVRGGKDLCEKKKKSEISKSEEKISRGSSVT